jgi:hypothetical protein
VTEFTAAADEVAATKLVSIAQGELGTQSASGSGSLGPFNASWSASASFSDGTVDLIAPNVIRIANCDLNYSLSFTLSFDLSDILPDFCLPQVCVDIPFIGRVCVPPTQICIDWPTISIPVSHSGTLKFTADFNPNVYQSGGDWLVDLVIVSVPFLQFGPQAALILAAIGAAASLALLAVPFIGPFLALAVAAITAAIGIAGLTGFLGTIITPFVQGLAFNIYRQPQTLEVVPATAVDPAVTVTLDAIAARVDSTDEDELVLTADISP